MPHNLLPSSIRAARVQRIRKTFWTRATIIYLLLLTSTCAIIRLATNPTLASATTELAALQEHRKSTASQIATTNQQLTRLRLEYELRHSIATQPNHGLLLTLLTYCVAPDTTLRQLSLRPTSPPPSISSSEREPRHFLLTIRGVSADEAGVSRLTASLRSLNVFDAVDLKRTSREVSSPATLSNPPAISFEITCLLIDTKGGTK